MDAKMCDDSRLTLQERIKEQGEIVRKLKAEQANKNKVSLFDITVYLAYDASYVAVW